MLARGGTEFEILLDKSAEELAVIASDPKIAEGIMRVRREEVSVVPGFDGEFGKISIFREDKKARNVAKNIQMKMFGE